jgi:hypothetical protein
MQGHFGYLHFKTLRYDPGIMSVMPMAVGCLTMKNTQECMVVFSRCLVVFVDFFHFLLLFFTIYKFFKLLYTVKRGKVCYFFYYL